MVLLTKGQELTPETPGWTSNGHHKQELAALIYTACVHNTPKQP